MVAQKRSKISKISKKESALQVLCIGSATLDTYIHTTESYNSYSLGDKVLVSHQEHQVGGGAANVAIGLRRQQINVSLAAKLGYGHNGLFISSQLAAEKIPNFVKPSSRCHTDTAFILSSSKDADRIIFVNKDASVQLSERDVPRSLFLTKKPQWVYLSTVLEKSLKTMKRVIPQVKKSTFTGKNARVQVQSPKLLFNPSLYLAAQGSKSLAPILKHTDLLILNKEEAMALLGVNKNANSLKFYQALLDALRACGPKLVVITNGPKRLHASDGIMLYTLDPPLIKVVHSAGAGDAFNAGILAALCQKKDFASSLLCGQANASTVLRKLGTTKGLLHKRDVAQTIAHLKLEVKSHRLC